MICGPECEDAANRSSLQCIGSNFFQATERVAAWGQFQGKNYRGLRGLHRSETSGIRSSIWLNVDDSREISSDEELSGSRLLRSSLPIRATVSVMFSTQRSVPWALT